MKIKIIVLLTIILTTAAGCRPISFKQTEAHGTKTMGYPNIFQAEDAPDPESGEETLPAEEETLPAEEETLPAGEESHPAGDGESISGEETSPEPEVEEGLASPERPKIEPEPEAEAGFETEPQADADYQAETEPAGESEDNPQASEGMEESFYEAPEWDEVQREPFITLSPYEAVVKNYAQLKSALEDDNGITTVYFGADITIQLTGIQINSNKRHVTVSGINPLAPEQTLPHTLTDHSSASFYNTIYIDEAGVETLHVRDLTITGKNFYSSFGVFDSGSLAGLTVTYERVNYDGPQFCYHRRGTVNIVDCAVKIHGGNGGSERQEFSEVKHLVFKGKNTIDTVTSAYTVFWHPFGGTFNIADDSSLTLTSPNTSDAFGVFYADSAAYDIDIAIGRRAVFDATISGAFLSGVYANLSGFTVHEGGAFYLATTKTALTPVLKTGGPLTVQRDAKFIISAYGGSALYAILGQEDGDITVDKDATFHITANNSNLCLLNLYGSAFICNDPSSVLFYNAGRNIRAASLTALVSVSASAQQVNYWRVVSSGSLDEPPLYKWERSDKANFSLNGTLAYGDNGNFTSLSSNYIPGDPPGMPPSAATFNMINARVLSFGQLELTVTNPTTTSTAISGVTEPGAIVRASFTQQGIDYNLPDVTADSEGFFHIPVGVALMESTVVTVKSGWQYLTATAEAVVTGEGALTFFVPDYLDFFTTELASHTQTVKRLRPDWEIVVSDTRRIGAEWSIYTRLESEMTPASASRPILDGALIFVDDFGHATTMRTDTDILILRHIPAGDEELSSVAWDENKGILLTVKPGLAFADTVYTASISWTLVDGP